MKRPYSITNSKLIFMVLLATTISCVIPIKLYSNNIRVTNITLGNNDYVNKTMEINFDLAWDNSWRTSTLESNWDAAWVILKYKINTSVNYNYFSSAKLAPSGHTAASGSIVKVAPGQQGAMIYRNSDGVGNISWTGFTLLWDYGSNFIGGFEALSISLIATEMVYIPAGAFYVGDASSAGRLGDAQGNPFLITNENTVTLGGGGTNINSVGGVSDDFNQSNTQILPADFPKGFDAFYIMKYELSLGQCLTASQLTANYNTYAEIHFGNEILGEAPIWAEIYLDLDGNGNSGYIYQQWDDDNNVYYYDDQVKSNYIKLCQWYGLRPMTELEYEKASRGSQNPVMNEYPWGESFISFLPYYFQNNDNVDASGFGNAVYKSTYPNFDITFELPKVNVGYFASQAQNPTRQITGSSYYGVQELAGSAREPVVTIGKNVGRQFTKIDPLDLDSYYLTLNLNFIGYKGGYFNSEADKLKVSDRSEVNSNDSYSSGRMVISDF